ncbi:MAG: peptide ABC transporter substrate-binding protein [Kofleriaceae bacterium]|nr:peptide ABC transporter substrate-binding protein [Kofleriaceae bacterium]
MAPTGRAVVASLAALITTSCGMPEGDYFGRVPDISGRNPRHLRWCNSGEPESMDPAQASTTTAMKLLYSMFDGLMVYDQKGLPTPSLATQVDQAPDLRRFTFTMHDKGRWSNGRPLSAYDIAYSVARVLHPLTASPNADGLDSLKNQKQYVGNVIRVVLRDVGELRAGELVDVVGMDGKSRDELDQAKVEIPDSNKRTGSKPLALRDLGAAERDAYARVPAGSEVTLIELSGRPAAAPHPDGATAWAYVHTTLGATGSGGTYGWVPAAELDGLPHAAVRYQVKRLPMKRQPGLDASAEELAADEKVERPTLEATGADLLMLPEALGMRTPDARTVVLETTNPTPFFLNLTNNRVLRPTPREAVSRRPKRWAEPGTIVTSGPMHLTVWKERDRIELVRSPTYWNPSEVKLDKLTAFSLEDQATTANYYATGGCDATTSNNIPASYLPVLSGEKRGGAEHRYKDYFSEPYLGIYFAFVNTKKVNNRHLRRAMAHAIDRRPIPNITKGGQIPTTSLSPGTPISKLTDDELALCGVTRDQPGVAMLMITGQLCYVPPPGLDFDPAKAKEELALAKQEMGPAFPKTLTYRYNTGSESHKYIAEFLQSSWKDVLGLDIRLESQEWKVFVNDTREGNYELARFGSIMNFPDTEAELLPNWRCESPDNRSQWCRPEFEELVVSAQPLADRKARLEKIYAAEKYLLEDVAVIPLYVYTQQHLQKPYVRDLFINLVDQPPMYRAYLDPNWASAPAPAAGGSR